MGPQPLGDNSHLVILPGSLLIIWLLLYYMYKKKYSCGCKPLFLAIFAESRLINECDNFEVTTYLMYADLNETRKDILNDDKKIWTRYLYV